MTKNGVLILRKQKIKVTFVQYIIYKSNSSTMKRFGLFTTIATALLIVASNAFAQIPGIKTPDSIEFQSGTNVCINAVISTAKESVTLHAKDAWFGVANRPSIAKRQKHTVHLWAEPNFTTKERTSSLVITTADGKSHEIKVSQPPYLTSPTTHTAARLMLQKGASHTGEWEESGICSTRNGSGYFAVVPVHGKPLATGFDKGLTIASLDKGDYLLFVMPNGDIKAGALFDFGCTLNASDELSPTHFIFEYWDGSKWVAPQSERLRRTANGEPYSFYNKYFRSAHYTTFAESFRLEEAATECVKVRLRVVKGGQGVTNIAARSAYVGMQLIHYPHIGSMRDSHRILFVGNSFTYYFGTPFMLKEIAASQGHAIDAVVSIKGGQEFAEHLLLERTIEAIERGGYDYAFLQDSSPNQAYYADTKRADIRSASRQINQLTLKHSPKCRIIYEHTWAGPYQNYRGFGSYERLDALLYEGVHLLAKEVGNVWGISPIGEGFRQGRMANLPLLYRDNRHQSREGAYMKSCINYLYLFGEPFDERVADCGINPQIAATIRRIATEVVAKARKAEKEGKTGEWKIWSNYQ